MTVQTVVLLVGWFCIGFPLMLMAWLRAAAHEWDDITPPDNDSYGDIES